MKYDDLVAEAEKRAKVLVAKPASENSDPHTAELLSRLAAAIEKGTP